MKIIVISAIGILALAILLISIKILQKYHNNSIAQLDILNVDKNEDINSIRETIVNNKKFCHVSLDDFITAFEDITVNQYKYNSIFENSTFLYLKRLHDTYGVVVSLYTYYENDNRRFKLSQCTDKFAKEFEQNSKWLKFGFHTYNGGKNYKKISFKKAKNDYDKVIEQLLRIAGEKSVDKVIRLQNFAGNKESINSMINTSNGIKGLLGADDRRRSYYLDDTKNSYLYKYKYYNDNGFHFFKTDLRMELINNIDEELDKIKSSSEYDILIVFTHEWQLSNNKIKEKLEKCCEFAINNGYDFDYPMNRVSQ